MKRNRAERRPPVGLLDFPALRFRSPRCCRLSCFSFSLSLSLSLSLSVSHRREAEPDPHPRKMGPANDLTRISARVPSPEALFLLSPFFLSPSPARSLARDWQRSALEFASSPCALVDLEDRR